jgi:hypothetical protein
MSWRPSKPEPSPYVDEVRFAWLPTRLYDIGCDCVGYRCPGGHWKYAGKTIWWQWHQVVTNVITGERHAKEHPSIANELHAP